MLLLLYHFFEFCEDLILADEFVEGIDLLHLFLFIIAILLLLLDGHTVLARLLSRFQAETRGWLNASTLHDLPLNEILDLLASLGDPDCDLLLNLIVKVIFVGSETLFVLVHFVFTFYDGTFILVVQLLPHHALHSEYAVLHNAEFTV